jgi:hypothetical protein
MNHSHWEAFISQIVAESGSEPKEAGKQKVLTLWRSKLQQKPTSLQPFQIDEIMRQVRKRLDYAANHSLQPAMAQ